MIFDPTINVGSIVIILLGLVSGYVALRASMSGMATQLRLVGERVGFLETDIKALNKLMISNAVTEERIASLREDLSTFMVAHTNADTEFKSWVRSNMNRMESESKGLELKVLALSLSLSKAQEAD